MSAKKTGPIPHITQWERAMDQAAAKRAALSAALESRLRDIYSYFRRLGVDAASAEDLAQDTFVDAWRSVPGLRDERKLRGWLYRIAHRRYLTYRDKTASHATVQIREDLAAGPSHNPGSDDCLAAQTVRKALGTLPEKYLHPLALIYWEELSYKEAARVLSLPIGTLAWRVHKALKLMRQALAEEGIGDETVSHGPQTARATDSLRKD